MVCHSLLDFSTRSRLWFDWPVSGKDSRLDSPWIYAETPVFNGDNAGLVLGI